jgi:hypothetical protein
MDARAAYIRFKSRRTREEAMAEGAWRRVLTDCFTPEELKEWQAAKERLGPGFDHAGHAAAWADYNARVQAALPLDPDSAETKAIVTEWDALCADYMRVADPAMKNGPKPLWSFPMRLDDPEMFIQKP